MSTVAIMKVSLATIILLSAVALAACTITLSPAGEVYVCPGQSQTFRCSVSNPVSSARLEWRIEFENSRSVQSVIQEYASSDFVSNEEQRDERNGISFVFNLLSNGTSNLKSSMTITVDEDNGTIVIDNATVYCGKESDPKAVIRVSTVPTSSQMHLTREQMPSHLTNITETFIIICWTQIEMADQYIVSIYPSVHSESTFITANTSIQLPLLHNLVYDISIMASNCAGNSTSKFLHNITLNGHYCNTSTTGLDIIAKSNSSEIEVGSQINFYCQDGLAPSNGQNMTATCMSNGTWSPGLHTLKCSQKTYSKVLSNSKTKVWLIVTTTILVISLIVLILVVSVFVMRGYKKRHYERAVFEHANHYTDCPTSYVNVTDDQEQGVYSMLQPVESVMISRDESRDQSDQRQGLVYADVRSMLPVNAKTNISLQLAMDDDQVQYADVKHQDADSNQSIGHDVQIHDTSVPVNLDNMLIHLRSQLTSKWKEFGLAAGITEEVLEKCSNYPPEESIVEVFDIWLRNYQRDKTCEPTWKDVAKVLKDIGLQQLAERIVHDGPPKPVQVDLDGLSKQSFKLNLQSSKELLPPVPPKLVDFDEEMASDIPSKAADCESNEGPPSLSFESSLELSLAPPLPPKYI